MRVAVIGGGAAGFFAALSVKEHHPDSEVNIYEKSNKVLAKVKVSGGGRCNVTNGAENHKQLLAGYPRGATLLKKAFHKFDNQDTQAWFIKRGVPLYTQDDMRVFPVSDNSQSIIDSLLQACEQSQIQWHCQLGIQSIQPEGQTIQLTFTNGNTLDFDKVIIATGGSPKLSGYHWLSSLGHSIVTPVPSLFTFNMPGESIKELMGVATQHSLIAIQGTKLKSEGPILITHWGMSGPGILKLSAFGAEELNHMNYQFKVQVNWLGMANQEEARQLLSDLVQTHPHKLLSNLKPSQIPQRLWLFLLDKVALTHDKKWGELGKKGLNKITNILCNDVFEVNGKTTFKEEFVTCGGVDITQINHYSMQSKVIPNLYFAGEVLNIDGITGGYNFQAAWTTGYIAGKLQ